MLGQAERLKTMRTIRFEFRTVAKSRRTEADDLDEIIGDISGLECSQNQLDQNLPTGQLV